MEEFEESASAKKTKTIYISTVFGIAMVLSMVGLLGLILVEAHNLSNYVKENIVLNVYVDDAAHETDVIQLQKQIQADPMVKDAQYVSKELAARNLQKDLGEDFVKFLGYNPLSQSIDVYLKADYANNPDIEHFKTELLKNPMVKEVKYQKSLVDQMNENITTISLVILAFAAIFVVLSVALINNTIRLAIYSQRFLIKSMQLVGATKGFYPQAFFAVRHLARHIRSIDRHFDPGGHAQPGLQRSARPRNFTQLPRVRGNICADRRAGYFYFRF